MSRYQFKGRLWTITDESGRLISDIDTDQIFHKAHLHITTIEEMGQYTFANLSGWTDFSNRALPGDIVLAGANFGAGSSRQQAVDCFRSLGISLVIASSFGAIYKRNAINCGFPILTAAEISQQADCGLITNLDECRVDLLKGEFQIEAKELNFKINPFSKVQMDIYEKGSLLNI